LLGSAYQRAPSAHNPTDPYVNAISATSSFVVRTAIGRRHELVLVALLLVETFYLSVTLDTQPLIQIQSIWGTVIGWAPQYLRLAIATAALTFLFGGRRFMVALITPREHVRTEARLQLVGVHLLAVLTLASISSVVFAAGPSVAARPGLWAAAWSMCVVVSISTWALALFPARHWRDLAIGFRTPLALGVAGGTAVWLVGILSEKLWTRLAGYTFSLVAAVLRLVYPDVVSRPEVLAVGTSRFRVVIAPDCSGYEGIGLILAFLGIYLFAFRKDLRFPAALILLPLGAASIWLLNAIRIVGLIALGTAGWRQVALGGFHSQAGWLLFNALALTMVVAINRGGYFLKVARVHAATDTSGPDSTTALLGPFVAMLAAATVTSAFSSGFDYLYPLRLVAVTSALWACRGVYRTITWRGSLMAVAIGAATAALWIVMVPPDLSSKSGWPAALNAMTPEISLLWLACRTAGYVLMIPLIEELAFRGYVMRRLIASDIDSVPLGTFRWLAFLGSSLLFGAFHGQLWLQGTIAGMAFGAALVHRRSLGDAVLAHATTNGLIACYVFYTGHWSIWS